MRFDFCIGNPPYNEEFGGTGDNETYAVPVYNAFIDAANDVADKVELIHPARFLFNAGSTPKAWNRKMLQDKHFKVLQYEEDATRVFPNTDIKGGIAISYHDKNNDFGAIGVFTKFDELNGIVSKIIGEKPRSLSEIIFTQNRFNLDNLFIDHPDLRKVIGSEGRDKRFRNNIFDKVYVFMEKPGNDTIPTIGVVKNKRMWRHINKSYVDESHENLSKWKTLVSRANGSGKFGETLTLPVCLKPYEAYTQTFIGVGAFDSCQEAENVIKYLKTKFARAMLGVLKVTQDNDREAWRMVPLQDFTNNSDIDWNKAIHEIDRQLYKKYNLTQEEIDFIESNVKEMA